MLLDLLAFEFESLSDDFSVPFNYSSDNSEEGQFFSFFVSEILSIEFNKLKENAFQDGLNFLSRPIHLRYT